MTATLTKAPCAVKERPILFSGKMVKAILLGAKSQTRRTLNPQPDQPPTTQYRNCISDEILWGHALPPGPSAGVLEYSDGSTRDLRALQCKTYPCPYGSVGDRLWVRETWAPFDINWEPCAKSEAVNYSFRADHLDPKGDGPANPMRWHPSIFMPRRACRIELEITSVRVERLQSISEADAYAEGCTDEGHPYLSGYGGRGVINNYAALWDSINRKHPGCAWSDNPWCWCLTFRRIDAQNGNL